MPTPKIPVILDTDIGTDIDDTWALIQLLRSPEIDLKLTVSATHDTRFRAKILAKLLALAGRTDIPVAIGVPTPWTIKSKRQAAWVEDYDLAAYPGAVIDDGVRALIDAIMQSPQQMTLLAIGPLTNIAAALTVEPRIAPKTRLVGMLGSVRRGYDNAPKPCPEYNIFEDIPAAKQVFDAPWAQAVITPLDTCGLVTLMDDRYRAIRTSNDPLLVALMDNYIAWCGMSNQYEFHSKTIYDTVAAFLCYSTDFLKTETVRLTVDDKGNTVEDPSGRPFQAALEWTDLNGYVDHLCDRLLGR